MDRPNSLKAYYIHFSWTHIQHSVFRMSDRFVSNKTVDTATANNNNNEWWWVVNPSNFVELSCIKSFDENKSDIKLKMTKHPNTQMPHSPREYSRFDFCRFVIVGLVYLHNVFRMGDRTHLHKRMFHFYFYFLKICVADSGVLQNTNAGCD